MRFLLLGVLIALWSSVECDGAVAIGNLAVVFQGEGYSSTKESPLKGKLNDLWCQASRNGQKLNIANARFVRVHDRKVLPAHIDDEQQKAVLIFGNVPVTDAAKYRCEITTEDGAQVFGNMFAYSHVVMHTNESLRVHRPDGHAENELAAKTPLYVNTLGEDFHLECPAVGYPHPHVVWYKDGLPIDPDDKYSMRRRQLVVKNFEESDKGIYRCKAYNKFAPNVDGNEEEHELSLDFNVQIAGTYGWIYPLILIGIILLLLFVIIYSCHAYKRYKADHYNVAKRERQLRKSVDEERQLAEEI